MTTRLVRFVDDIQGCAYTLRGQVDGAQSNWNDVNYERLANGATSAIMQATNSFCSNARSTAENIYMDMMSIESLINDL